jgi:chaperone BCS1
MSSIEFELDNELIQRIKNLETLNNPETTIIIENDNPLWLPIIKYGALIKKKDTPLCDNAKRAFGYSKSTGLLELCLAPGKHILVWDGFEYPVELFQNKDREHISISMPSSDAYYTFQNFIVHARECSQQKSNTDNNNVVVKVLVNSSWRTVSSYPKRAQESLITGDDTVRNILEDMKSFLGQEEKYENSGRPFKRNYLLLGPPGSGKSSLITIIASVLNLDIYFISITSNMNEKNLCAALNVLNKNSLLVIEDIDTLCDAATSGNQGAINALVSLTNILDGTLHKHKLITILTSANSKSLDNVLLRHGRIDYTSKLSELSKKQVTEMVKYTFKSKEGCGELANRIWNKIGNYHLSSSILANFLFNYEDKNPNDISEEDCNHLILNTKKEHISEESSSSSNLWM